MNKHKKVIEQWYFDMKLNSQLRSQVTDRFYFNLDKMVYQQLAGQLYREQGSQCNSHLEDDLLSPG